MLISGTTCKIFSNKSSFWCDFEMKSFVKILFIIAGFLSLGLGILGIILPLLPTTPLILLAAACFVRGSDRLYQWLLHNKWFGKYIRDFRAGRGIPLKAKIIGITALWLSLGFSVLFVVDFLPARVILLGIGTFFTWLILSFKTANVEQEI